MSMEYRTTITLVGIGANADEVERVLDHLIERAPGTGAVASSKPSDDEASFTLSFEDTDAKSALLRSADVVLIAAGRAFADTRRSFHISALDAEPVRAASPTPA